jgi:type I restriction enzyme R subunit
MDETATRRKKIDPKLYEVGWEQVPESEILTEQSAYQIAPGQVSALPQNRHPKKADYLLKYKQKKLAVIEAKSDEKHVSEGIPQAKLYAELLHIRFAYATNGNEIWQVDMGVKDNKGEYIIPSKEGPVDRFPTPQELWQMTFPEQNPWLDRFNHCPLNRGGGREPRYYQEIAIDAVLAAVAKGEKRILLTMATGTGKTYTAFQICWKLYQSNWNNRGTEHKPRILFISDRNILANQAKNDFEQFPEDAMERVTPELIHDKKHRDHVPTARHLYFTIFQTVMGADASGKPYYMQWQPDFFDLIIIDECHRGGANDESEWRQLMVWFDPAVQLGMTATPRSTVNVDTYAYFGHPVYTYSLKQGIDDGFLTPFRVKLSESNIDTYRYDPNDDVEGDIDPDRVYTEQDFYQGNIEMRQRDEHRVKELLEQINPDDKTIIFCATQHHANLIMGMVNQHKKRPDNNYCRRVTANDGDRGEQDLKRFQDNDRLRPTILTTSQKLSTGVDAKNVRNIVLMRPVNNMVEFKQIMGRGTRLFDGKYYFTIYDFVGAFERFRDDGWDGPPPCPRCGQFPCVCPPPSVPKPCSKCGKLPCECPKPKPEPCPVCGNLPCTCGVGRSKVVVKLSATHALLLHTEWTEKVMYADKLITIEDYIRILFGRLPEFFSSDDDLRKQWSQPETRQQLLDVLARSGFEEEKLETVRRVMNMENCDMLDVLENIAYNSSPIDRQKRAELLQQEARKTMTRPQMEFVDFIMQLYVRNGFKELDMDKLPTLIQMKYNTPLDAIRQLGMQASQVRQLYLDLQRNLYNGDAVVNFKIINNFNSPVGQVIQQEYIE